ncbi:hypothetical protein [Neorhizobium sp. JUb45]|uniref:hypothetical protein n=1 Tax=unclassified Neorhizobium TaxID=2629175 RepID=UPI0010477007|nr:hypothetical protein [Neorhizobium sp. JUb45]TCR06334.1 hypothetical protein EDF70_101287 [Neorhizobium sp. JUb45]
MPAGSARNAIVSLIFCLSAMIAVASALGFAIYSGFFAGSTETLFRCSELFSSGGDDEVAMLFSIVVVPSILWRLFRWNREISNGEVVAFFALSIGALALMVMSLECGEFFFTAFGVGDRYLQVFCVFSVVAAGALIAQKVVGAAKQ